MEECREYIHKIEDLKTFQYTEPNTGKDQVREKKTHYCRITILLIRITILLIPNTGKYYLPRSTRAAISEKISNIVILQ